MDRQLLHIRHRLQLLGLQAQAVAMVAWRAEAPSWCRRDEKDKNLGVRSIYGFVGEYSKIIVFSAFT